jgi:predicted Zn-dependent protease
MRKGIISALALLTACGPETPPDYRPEVTQEDREIGAEQHPQLLAEFGGDYPGKQADYLKSLGAKVADAAGLDGECTFTLVNSDVVNAFAVPGCYIYVTRGLLAIVGSEAELASVLAHEVGHIVGAHAQRQQNRSLWRTLGVLAVSLAGSEQLTRLAGEAAQFFSLRYSRTQEYEADTLGIRYLRDAGYDPYAASDMLTALGRQERFMSETRSHDEARAIPEWASSHPLTENRIARARGVAKETGLAEGALPEKEEAYLEKIDGLLYGDDPEQGFVLGRRFVHPVMRIAFEAPQGFTLTNSPQAIAINGPDGIRGEFGGGRIPAAGLEAYAAQLAEQSLGRDAPAIGDGETRSVNGLHALIYDLPLNADQGRVMLSLAVYDGGHGEAYHFIMIAPPSAASAQSVNQLFRSFRLASQAEAAALRPRRLRVVTVTAGQPEAQLWRGMATEHPQQLFLILNGLDTNRSAPAGSQVKLVEYAS